MTAMDIHTGLRHHIEYPAATDTGGGPAPAWLEPTADAVTTRPQVWSRTTHRRPDGVVEVGGVAVSEIAARFGTPVYVVDEAEFQERCDEFARACQGMDVYYAGKAFLCRAVARWLAASGLSLDVCSGGELAVALDAGFPPGRVLMHGNNKSAAELEQALTCRVGRIVVDSFDEIALLDRLAVAAGVRQRVLVRVTVGVRPDVHANIATAHEDQKFGFLLSDGSAERAVATVLTSQNLEISGLHMHLGSQILDPLFWDTGVERIVDLHAQVARRHGVEMPELDLGGGFGIAYVDGHEAPTPVAVAARLRRVVEQHCVARGVVTPRLAVEPGRAIAGPAGCTIYRVGTVKVVPGRRTYVAVDGGMSDNIRPALYDGVYSAALAERNSSVEPTLCRVVGKHCDAGDIVVPDEFLPADVRAGDLLVVAATGAYCRSLSNNFNYIGRPPVVAVRDGQARAIVRREGLDDLLRLDVG